MVIVVIVKRGMVIMLMTALARCYLQMREGHRPTLERHKPQPQLFDSIGE
jgi:hypothetical protein